MFNRFSTKMAPAIVGVLSAWMLNGCGGAEVAQIEEPVTVTTKATLNQHDFDSFLTGIKLSSCTFAIAAGTGTFTPSSELSQVLYGDPNGSAHKLTFPVPVINTPSATLTITSLQAEMASTGITLSGTSANVHLAFDGLLHVSVTVPVFGKLPADIQIKSSSIAVNLAYDAGTERAKAASVVSHFDVKTQKCGGSGWCNGIVDNLLKTNLAGMVEVPLRDAITKGLDSASATDGLNELLAAAYNVKDHQATPWTMVAHTLTLASSQFSFTAQRN